MSSHDVDGLTAAILAVEGVAALHPADPWRAARIDQVPAPGVRVRDGEVRLTVRVAVTESAGAETTAARVAEVARDWAVTHHPDLTPTVTVRVVTIEPV